MNMFFRIAFAMMRVVEIAFFTGLVGCAFVVVLSWIDIVKEGFRPDRN